MECCRFNWHPRILAFFITAALGLSIVSSLDCKFLMIDLGFIPQDYHSNNLGFGLWAHTAPGGRCLSYSESRQSGVFSGEDTTYTSLFMNGDINWSISRILAIVGVVFGTISLVSMCGFLISIFTSLGSFIGDMHDFRFSISYHIFWIHNHRFQYGSMYVNVNPTL